MMYLTDDEREQLEQIQVGTSVARFARSFYGPDWQAIPIKRMTAKQIVLTTDDRYWKRNGQEVGGSGGWSHNEIFPLNERTQNEIAKARVAFDEQQRRAAATKFIRNTTFRWLPLDVLEQIAALIAGAGTDAPGGD